MQGISAAEPFGLVLGRGRVIEDCVRKFHGDAYKIHKMDGRAIGQCDPFHVYDDG